MVGIGLGRGFLILKYELFFFDLLQGRSGDAAVVDAFAVSY